MANRSYIYSASKRPQSYQDRPDQIHGVSEWASFVPFTFRVLMSGEPVLASSLIYENLEEDDLYELDEDFESDSESEGNYHRSESVFNDHHKIYAISSESEIGLKRLKKINRILKVLNQPVTIEMSDKLTQMLEFISARKLEFFHLETIEIDIMCESDYQPLRECVEQEIQRCIEVGSAIDLLSDDVQMGAKQFLEAINNNTDSNFNAFFGLRLDQNYDNPIERLTELPFGLEYAEHLYFKILNKSEAEKFNQVE